MRTDLLQVAIVDIYLNLKKQISNFNHQMDRTDLKSEEDNDAQKQEKEQKRLLSLGNLVLVDYVRSMIDLLLDYMHSANKTLEKAK